MNTIPFTALDDVFSSEEVERYYGSLSRASYKLWHVSDRDEPISPGTAVSFRFLQAHFDVPDFTKTDLGKRLVELANDHWPNYTLRLENVFCMCLRYGDTDYFHKDFFSTGSGLSLVYYANNFWHPDWGAETLFRTHHSGVFHAANVIPGRVLLFDGTNEHRAGVPTRAAAKCKLSLNLRFIKD